MSSAFPSHTFKLFGFVTLRNPLNTSDHGAIRPYYPELWSFLGQDRNTRCPDCICLGPEGSYFINIAGNKSIHYHQNSSLALPISQIKRLWWGYQGSFVVESEDGQVMVDLRGYYDGLETLLSEKGPIIKVG